MTNKKIFLSNTSFEDAKFKAKMAGYQVTGQGRNKRGQFAVFGKI